VRGRRLAGARGKPPSLPEGAGDPRPESPPRREDPGHAPASTPGPVVYLEPPDTTVFTWASQHVVEGRLEHAPGGRVRIGSRVLLPDAGGRFRHAVTLVEEETTLEIRGVAADGTVGEPVTLRIVVDKDAPVLRIEEPVEGHLTNESRVRIRGRVEDSHPGPIRLGTREFTPEDDGTFVTDIELEGGDHVLRFRAEDAAGNLADPVVRRVTVDTTPPRLEIDPVESPTVAERVTVRGGCEPGCELELDGKAVEVNAEGRFGVAVPLAGGANAFEAVARDRAGNRTSRTIRIERRVPDPSRREGPYDSETMRRFRETVEKAAWGEPRWNGQKTLEVEHRATGLVFVLVPGGTFRMGSPVDEEGRREYEGPAHERRVGGFPSEQDGMHAGCLDARGRRHEPVALQGGRSSHRDRELGRVRRMVWRSRTPAPERGGVGVCLPRGDDLALFLGKHLESGSMHGREHRSQQRWRRVLPAPRTAPRCDGPRGELPAERLGLPGHVRKRRGVVQRPATSQLR
jgi:hypothetical protein